MQRLSKPEPIPWGVISGSNGEQHFNVSWVTSPTRGLLNCSTSASCPRHGMRIRKRALATMEQCQCAVDMHYSELNPPLGGSDTEDLLLLPTLLRATRGRPGTFVEMGALDGITGSTTLVLERCFNWTGLLIEGNPKSYAKLIQSRRTATKVHSAACAAGRYTLPFMVDGGPWAGAPETMSAGLDKKLPHRSHRVTNVPCKPLPAILAEHLGSRACHVDFFSLDVEEAEAAVLLTGPHPLGDCCKVLMTEVSTFNLTKNAMVDELATAEGKMRIARGITIGRSQVYVRPSLTEVFVNASFVKLRLNRVRPTAVQLFEMVNLLHPDDSPESSMEK